MPLKIFTIRDTKKGEKEYQEWMEQNPGIKVQTRHICPHNDQVLIKDSCDSYNQVPVILDRLFVFYETANDNEYRKNRALIEENAQLEMCVDVAKSLKGDPVMRTLTNKAQKRAYLLHAKNLPAGDADLVMELLSPGLKGLLE